MKKIIKISTLSLLAILFASCDPTLGIDFVNKTNDNIKVKIVLEPELKDDILLEIAQKDSIIFNLKKDSSARINYGRGTWNEYEVLQFTNSVKSIEFDTKETKTIYKSKEAITDILNENKIGIFFRGQIEINIE